MTKARLRYSRPAHLAVTLAFAAGLFSAWHHQATAVHGFCSDHGAQIHLDHFHDEPGHHPNEANLHGHHHAAGSHDCIALAFLAQSALRMESALAGARVQAFGGLLLPGLAQAPGQIPPLHQSPKQSPPVG